MDGTEATRASTRHDEKSVLGGISVNSNRTLAVSAREKKILAAADIDHDDHFRWPYCAESRDGGGAVHIYSFLIG